MPVSSARCLGIVVMQRDLAIWRGFRAVAWLSSRSQSRVCCFRWVGFLLWLDAGLYIWEMCRGVCRCSWICGVRGATFVTVVVFFVLVLAGFCVLFLEWFCSDTVIVLHIFIRPCLCVMFLFPLCCTEDGGCGLVFVVAVYDCLCWCE